MAAAQPVGGASASRRSREMSPQHTAGIRPPWVDAELYPFESRFIELDGNSVHYVDEGSGPILLMLHGNPTWSFEYRDVIDSLRGSVPLHCARLSGIRAVPRRTGLQLPTQCPRGRRRGVP